MIRETIHISSPAMSFFFALFVWLVIAAILVAGVVMAVNGTAWLMLLSVAAFVGAFAKYGCAAH